MQKLSKVKGIKVDIHYLPMFKGYIVCFAFRWFWFSYYYHLKAGFKNLRFGTILFVLIMPFTAFVDVWKLTNDYVLDTLERPFEVYKMLSES